MWKRGSRVALVGVVVLLGGLLAVRAMLPGLVADHINGRLAQMGEYTGRLQDVDLHLWRGAYSIHDLLIRKREGGNPKLPLLDAPRIDLSVSWRELVRGAVVAEVHFREPRVNFLDAEGKGADQSGGGVNWREQLEALVPIKLDEVTIRDGVVHFEAFGSKPEAAVEATDVEAVVTNLTNVRGEDGQRVAKFEATASVLGQSPLQTDATFDPFGTMESFDFRVKVTKLDLTRLNDMLQAYVKVDVARGHGEFLMELEAKDGRVQGYAKPLFRDLDIVDVRQDVAEQKDNPFRLLWETLTGAATTALKNQPEDQFATRIPISGSIKNPRMHPMQALWAILENAFVEAFKPQFEGARRGD